MTDRKDKDEKTKADLGVLEEDDEFEEFPAEGITLFAFYFISMYFLDNFD